MVKIIVFSNIKGGVGKTTLCALFASYLTEKGVPVQVLDADIQASLFRHREREAVTYPGQKIPYPVTLYDTSDQKLRNVLSEARQWDGITLIDCPGNVNDPNLAYIYSVADIAIIPMAYDVDTVDATGLFVQAIRPHTSAEMLFVPNRINTTEGKAEELRQREQTRDILDKIGTMTPRIKQTVVVKRYSTVFPLDRFQRNAVEHAFDVIIKKINL